MDRLRGLDAKREKKASGRSETGWRVGSMTAAAHPNLTQSPLRILA
jgi:hypothetical protein